MTKENIKQFSEELIKLNLSLLSEGQLHSVKQSFIPQNLYTSTYVWLRTVRKPLEASYSGPYKVITRYENTL